MIEIDIQPHVDIEAEWLPLLETAVHATLAQQQYTDDASLSIVLTDDAQLHTLNATYRQTDAPTDVLSFPAGDTPGMEGYLGDIVMSVAYAQRNAEAEGHTLADELQLLTVHGVLHLLGHDHMEAEEKEAMWAAQTAVLSQLGIHIEIPDA